jgi:hypothetical protein
MTRILTIIALLFATPAWAKTDVSSAEALKILRDGQILSSNMIGHRLYAIVKLNAELFHCEANEKQVWCKLYKAKNK